ncbi:unnamed protein product [Anisakis simplex]|uniref:Myosin_tail_1 domain-containing protein n=1 Tax=Anisakis simplex TaxID=6269 RepID=A0A0M3J978_ANISI|nr:unnamed protein product [Anisakis simplex]
MEMALMHANTANDEAQRNVVAYGEQIGELQKALEEEQTHREQLRNDCIASEKRLSVAQSEKDDASSKALQAERIRKQIESEYNEAKRQLDTFVVEETDLSAVKKRIEADILLYRILNDIQADLDEANNELKASEERTKNAAAEAARLSELLRQAQETSQMADRHRKQLETNIKELQSRVDDTELTKIKVVQKETSKAERRIKAVSSELENQQRRYQDTQTTIKKQDRKIRELEFQLDENKKRYVLMQETIDKLQQKTKQQKKLVDEAVSCCFNYCIHL